MEKSRLTIIIIERIHMAKNFNVADGAILTCSLGTKTCELRVPEFHGARVGEKAEATINDYKQGINIENFGICNKCNPSKPCQPIIISPWLLGNKGYQINGERVIMSNSILSCACGGIIKIQSGQ